MMAGHIGRYEFWTAYRRHLVRALLARGEQRSLIAERVGVTLRALGAAITRFGLDQPERVDG